MVSQLRRSFTGMLAAAAVCTVLPALPQPMPAGQAVLVISGKVAGPADGVPLDMAALEGLPQHSFTTGTPWSKAPQKFTGPLLRDVLRLAKAQGTSLKAMALNDYQVTIPVEDAQRETLIVALRIDGKPIPVRERGPLFVIYPFDSKPQLQSQRYYERSIWQLKSIKVE
ncbi:molybdopterin-dependent oxidoreductase [Ramlibacter sp.]|uniref:molybdopterin-dependent oxidoreductase n=1 Tax=Ramlibacter sp. TaxID=1917967 RepID=UPI0025D4DF40|nr:molybdopterin-dependent oxidoreductase [Ramlibacter sp.]